MFVAGVAGGHTSCSVAVGERAGEHRVRCCTACRCRVRRGAEGGVCFCDRGCGGGVTKIDSSSLLFLFALFSCGGLVVVVFARKNNMLK